ncbi:thioesterase family protein [Mycolicibacterium pallens]|uniref:Thioesterase family protein n=1 Tax=Mycolicibacterium pallens TaxID=370524 RepID=A0ABX8VQ95_9MYCO|nr:thioesterase family protein [Mycolicibacterium pallens]QYL17676.1 thioesterase family protein [Mycolicibacterium pallens]
MYPRFADAMTLTPVEDGFEANLNEHWTIGPKIHGGVMLALCANAARAAYGQEGFEPVAVSADFLSAPDPGSVRLITTVQKRGRRIGLVDVALTQGERTCVRTVVTLGDPEHHVEPLLSANPVTPLMSVEPPAHIEPIGPGHPAAAINNLARGCDIRPDLDETRTESGAPVYKIWVRPNDGPVDVLFALMCGDISVPACYAVGRRGWAPTVQMTAYLRGMPDDGWLRVACTTAQIGQDWFDEDHTVVDSAGRIIVQTRQLALVPAQ